MAHNWQPINKFASKAESQGTQTPNLKINLRDFFAIDSF